VPPTIVSQRTGARIISPDDRGHENAFVLDGIVHARQANLAKVGSALHLDRLSARAIQCRQKNPNQHGDDADHDEQFDKRKCGAFSLAHWSQFDKRKAATQR
jgi:hypothetical protein